MFLWWIDFGISLILWINFSIEKPLIVIFLIENKTIKRSTKAPKRIVTVFGVITLCCALKYNKPKIPKITVNTIWIPLQIRLKKMTFLVFDLSKNNAFPAYSPTPFGVKSPAVNAPRTCLVASPNAILWMNWTKFCHFKISKNRFKTLNTKIKAIPPIDWFF